MSRTRWATTLLADVASIERVTVAACEIEHGEHYVGLENITSDGRFEGVGTVVVGELRSNKFRFGPQHILYGKLRPYLSKIARPDFDGICSTDILPIRPLPGLDASYLLHFLRTPRMVDHAAVRSTGINLPRLSPRELARFEIPLPPIEEQRRIAAVLDAADALRTGRRQALAKLDTLTQAIFIDMFGDPLNQERVGSASTENSGLGALAHVRTGKLDANAASDDGRFPFFTCAVEPLRINEAAFDTKAILVAGNGDLNVKYYEGKFNAYQRTYVIDSLDERVALPRFLHGFLDIYVGRLREQAIGGVIKYIKIGNLTEAEVPLPGINTQAEYVRQIEAFDALRGRSNLALNRLDSLFSSLQQRAFRGEL